MRPVSWLRRAEGKKFCAWCGKDLGDAGFPTEADTHGLCPECKAMTGHDYFGDPLPEGVTEEQFLAWKAECARRRGEEA